MSGMACQPYLKPDVLNNAGGEFTCLYATMQRICCMVRSMKKGRRLSIRSDLRLEYKVFGRNNPAMIILSDLCLMSLIYFPPNIILMDEKNSVEFVEKVKLHWIRHNFLTSDS